MSFTKTVTKKLENMTPDTPTLFNGDQRLYQNIRNLISKSPGYFITEITDDGLLVTKMAEKPVSKRKKIRAALDSLPATLNLKELDTDIQYIRTVIPAGLYTVKQVSRDIVEIHERHSADLGIKNFIMSQIADMDDGETKRVNTDGRSLTQIAPLLPAGQYSFKTALDGVYCTKLANKDIDISEFFSQLKDGDVVEIPPVKNIKQLIRQSAPLFGFKVKITEWTLEVSMTKAMVLSTIESLAPAASYRFPPRFFKSVSKSLSDMQFIDGVKHTIDKLGNEYIAYNIEGSVMVPKNTTGKPGIFQDMQIGESVFSHDIESAGACTGASFRYFADIGKIMKVKEVETC